MSKVLVLGATGALGGYVTQQAIAANHRVSTLVRTPSKLQAELRERSRCIRPIWHERRHQAWQACSKTTTSSSMQPVT